MSLSLRTQTLNRAARSYAACALVGLSGLLSSTATAQQALGTPFIGANNLSFQSAELTRSGGAETTTIFGVLYGRRFGATSSPARLTMELRASARSLENGATGAVDAGASVGVSRDVRWAPGLEVAASTGAGMIAWGNDQLNTGRVQMTVPTKAGVSYDFRIKSATIAPFVTGTLAAYELRTFLDDVRQSTEGGWDASYASGVSLRLQEVVITTSRLVGERGMPQRSRWAFAAGISF